MTRRVVLNEAHLALKIPQKENRCAFSFFVCTVLVMNTEVYASGPKTFFFLLSYRREITTHRYLEEKKNESVLSNCELAAVSLFPLPTQHFLSVSMYNC